MDPQPPLPAIPPPQQPPSQNTPVVEEISRSSSPTARRPTTGTTGSSLQKDPVEGSEEYSSYRDHKDPLPHQTNPIRPLSHSGHGPGPGLRRPPVASMGPMSPSRRSVIDWVVPLDEKPVPFVRETSVGERLQPTISFARNERDKYAAKAKMTGYALNAAIGLQVVIGALITGLSAVTSGRQTSIMTSILGGFSTIVASYLARARGSNEPELSITRTKDLEQFLRECEAFQLDHGHKTGHEYDEQLLTFRRRFEELLGNANGERKLSNVV